MRRPFLLSAFVLVLGAPALAGAGVLPASRTPPPTPVPGYTSPSPFPTVLHTPEPTTEPPELHAAAAILEDLDTGQILFALHPDTRRPIASTTKIMTAYVVLDRTEPSDVVKVSAAAGEEGALVGAGFSELGLEAGERLSVQQLLYALLMQSANDAAVALADHVSGTTDEFVQLMNRQAKQLGLRRTSYYSPNGLDDRGYSTARSLAAITRLAEQDPTFERIVRTKFRSIPGPQGEEDRRIQNRNVLLWLYPGAIGVKTGFTSASGYCLVAAASRNGTHLLTVTLGQPSTEQSFSDAAALLDYGFETFAPRELVHEGQGFGTISAGDVFSVSAGADLVALVHRDETTGADLHVRRVTTSSVEVGDRVGWVIAALHDKTLGRVPLVATERLTQPTFSGEEPDSEAPWWQRSLETVNRAASGLFHAVFG